MSGRYTAARTAVCGWGVSFFNIVSLIIYSISNTRAVLINNTAGIS